MRFEDFWYVVALSEQLTDKAVLARTVLDEWLVIFRDRKGNPIALQDRCIHRNSRLSLGKLQNGAIQCPYHGWTYNALGEVIAVPAEGPTKPCQQLTRQAISYPTKEQDGYVYVRLIRAEDQTEIKPFTMPYYRSAGWETVRVINRFQNTVTNCAENFIDIPHTASVHPGIFRSAKQQQLQMTVSRRQGTVTATYQKETTNLGWFSWFLNPRAEEIKHIDQFFMPNITSVEYAMGSHRRCFITSQSVPETAKSTLVYTDVTFNYGIWSKPARPFVRWTAQRIIQQDVAALKIQQETIAKYGERFTHTPVDTIHVLVESIRNAIAQNKDPCQLPDKTAEVTFWV
ncbi:aromatic ring-hydroxylating dioxygenase subunit alpha [cf. Phormidesmis sp. LEGE 11477]|uniref:aromatic ring-hydroxylating dioxygenase subunit alpha n=1 Tax=cf. Phormidesmis sp. LEGE 11477 TaxID=1828680 RepID=UPI00187F866A|nr:aromatic ring-hydroxylating dioxygenase subunit alpha [cf. Phormidesmis sp. LEGE 11477]MBE9063700.1 aromatic ring-hydroxylating dioxygenase subunit alpha [cf. Phormidesmis sp. LEGE 11477]